MNDYIYKSFFANPWDVAEAARHHYDIRMQNMIALVLEACGKDQIELDPASILSGDALVEISHTAEGKIFCRIIGRMSLMKEVPQRPTLSGVQDTSDTECRAGSALPKDGND